MTDSEALAALRAHMAAHAEPADDITDDELRAAVLDLMGHRPRALELAAEMLAPYPRRGGDGG